MRPRSRSLYPGRLIDSRFTLLVWRIASEANESLFDCFAREVLGEQANGSLGQRGWRRARPGMALVKGMGVAEPDGDSEGGCLLYVRNGGLGLAIA